MLLRHGGTKTWEQQHQKGRKKSFTLPASSQTVLLSTKGEHHGPRQCPSLGKGATSIPSLSCHCMNNLFGFTPCTEQIWDFWGDSKEHERQAGSSSITCVEGATMLPGACSVKDAIGFCHLAKQQPAQLPRTPYSFPCWRPHVFLHFQTLAAWVRLHIHPPPEPPWSERTKCPSPRILRDHTACSQSWPLWLCIRTMSGHRPNPWHQPYRRRCSKCKDIPCLWIGRFNIVKMSSLPKVTRVSAVPIKIPVAFFVNKFFKIPTFLQIHKKLK